MAVMAASPREQMAGLDAEQLAAVHAPRGPVCVLAGAGTGKTRTIVHRIAALIHAGHVAAGQVLAVTFTNRAANELRTRLRALEIHGAQARTFHAAALRQLRYFWPRVVGGPHWQLLEGKLRLVGRAAQRAGVRDEQEALRDLATEIEWAKASLIGPDDYPDAARRRGRSTPEPVEVIAEVYRGYESAKTDARLLDFDDLLLHTAAALEDHPDVAEEFRDRYRCFVVDEYQDITPLQQRVLDAWLGERDDLTVVGDPNQTIYSFAGASARPLLSFTRRFPHAVVVRLERDYRSTPQVVALADRVISAARDRPAGSRLRLTGQRPDGPEPSFTEHADEAAEAAAVAGRVRELLAAGTPAGEIAVLYRINAQSEHYEHALSELDIPYLVRGGERFFARQEVRQAIATLRSAAGDPPAGELPVLVRALLAPLGLTAEAPRGGAARDRWESLRALVELATELTATLPGVDLAGYLAELEVRAAAAHPPAACGVTLASLHSAKGLEWDAVFLVGLVDGILPIQHADGDRSALEEERRLLYVGVTRARTRLSLSWALARSDGARRRRSRFLRGLLPERSTIEPAEPVDAGEVDEGLLIKLRHWRADRARRLKVPAFVVFTDVTLVAIARRRPTDRAGLVAIPGIGASKLDRFGAEVLAVVVDHAPTSDL